MTKSLIAAGILAVAASVASADTITLKNGDKISGTIGQINATTVQFESPSLGKINIATENVATYSYDQPVTVRPSDGPSVTGAATGTDTTVKVGGKEYALSGVKGVNPPAQVWTGAVVINGALARGNTNKLTVGVDALAGLRRNDDKENDRFTVGAGYNFGNSGRGDNTNTDTDNWNVFGKYDKFWTDQFYTYGMGKVEHDRIANLQYRASGQIGLGYQWFEGPVSNFSTEAGLGYVYERYDFGDPKKSDYVSGRLAYHYDRMLNEKVKFIHNVEWLPALDDPSDYVLTADAGIRADLTDKFFTQFKIVYKRDSQPAEGSLKNDLLYTLGIGWAF